MSERRRSGRARPFTSGILAAVLVVTGCSTTRQLGREDWGALQGAERVVVVTHSGVRHELESFQFLATGVIGRAEQGEIEVLLDSIAFVEVREANAAGTALTILGAGTAVGVLIAMTQSPVEPESCPFVYSFDGERYRFDSETFAGAIAQGLDRTDYDNLEHLRDVDGRYRIRLTNERPETQYTDELKLVVVDHPPGTQVIPDRAGVVHAISDPQPPRTARDTRGRDVVADVSVADDVFWRGSALANAEFHDGALREGLVLSFARPPGARSARLAVRARNTELAPFALQTFLELQGGDLLAWYQRVARESDLRRRLRGWVAREGTLHVSIQRNGQWVLEDALLAVGPAIGKTQIVPVELPDEPGDEVVVKLESATGLWAIDWVGLDIGEPVATSAKEISPSVARDERGRDLGALLAAADERYYATVRGAVADIEFDVPERPDPGLSRSVILKSRGFYYLYVSQRGPNRAELADRILDEPLVGNRYILQRWLAETDR